MLTNKERYRVASILRQAPFEMLATTHKDFDSQNLWFFDTVNEAVAYRKQSFIYDHLETKDLVLMLADLIGPEVSNAD